MPRKQPRGASSVSADSGAPLWISQVRERLVDELVPALFVPELAGAVQGHLARLSGSGQRDVRHIAWLNQSDIFVGTLSAQRVKKTFSDDAPILNFCRTFGHHRSPSLANQYAGL